MVSRRKLFVAAAALLFAVHHGPVATAEEQALDAAADATLERLYASEPAAKSLSKRAKGVLVFPEIVKGGLLIGAAGGEGVLRRGSKTVGKYLSTAVSYGLQAGVTTFGYVMFLMDDEALDYVEDTAGWEVGVGPNVTVADESVTKKLTTSTVQEGIYVFFVDQKGFYAGAGIEGTKITKVE